MSKQLTKRTNNLTTNGSAKPPPKQAEWAICDISGSMGTYVGDGKTRIECLNAALRELGDDVQVIAFSNDISREKVGEYTPQGGTVFCKPLREVAKYEPSYIVLISDGDPNDSQNEILGLVDKLAESAVIDTIYIGPDDSRCETFMQQIAVAGHGRFRKYDPTQISEKIQQLLPPPSDTVEL